jgi:hypothetical protein
MARRKTKPEPPARCTVRLRAKTIDPCGKLATAIAGRGIQGLLIDAEGELRFRKSWADPGMRCRFCPFCGVPLLQGCLIPEGNPAREALS